VRGIAIVLAITTALAVSGIAGPRRTISFHPLWMRPRRRVLPWVHATLRLCGISLPLPSGLRRH
jgi:hypothetical protein